MFAGQLSRVDLPPDIFAVVMATGIVSVAANDRDYPRICDVLAVLASLAFVLLTAGQTVSSASPLTWDRTRSAVGTCDDETRPRAPGGGASYHLAVEIGGVASTETTQFLLY